MTHGRVIRYFRQCVIILFLKMSQIGLRMFEIRESREISEDLHFKRMTERGLWQNNRISSIDTYLSENILRAFQFVQEDNVHVDHVVDVM